MILSISYKILVLKMQSSKGSMPKLTLAPEPMEKKHREEN